MALTLTSFIGHYVPAQICRRVRPRCRFHILIVVSSSLSSSRKASPPSCIGHTFRKYMIAFRDRGTVLLTVLMSIAYDYVRCNLMHSSVHIRPLLNRTHHTRVIFMKNRSGTESSRNFYSATFRLPSVVSGLLVDMYFFVTR